VIRVSMALNRFRRERMEAPVSNRLARIAVWCLSSLLAAGLWQAYGAWALDAAFQTARARGF